MNMSPYRLSMNCPRKIKKLARPAGLGTAGDARERVAALPDGLPDASMSERRERMARPAGLEPATPGLEGRCSIQLSYGRVCLS